MGYSIDLIDAANPGPNDCSSSIDKSFYNFIVSYETYGESSVLIQSGKYLRVDLKPLTKIAYTWDDLTFEEIEDKKQSLALLNNLIEDYRQKINLDLSFIKNVEFKFEDYYARYSEFELRQMKADGLLVDPKWNEKTEMHQYFINGQINLDINNFLEILNCLQANNVLEVVITAG